MAIEMRAYFCRLVRAGVGLLIGVLAACGAAQGQAPLMTTGSVVTIPSSTSWGQIYRILFYNGNVLALDTGSSALYQLAPGATTWSTISPPVTVGMFGASGGYTCADMTIDALGTLYIGIRYPVKADPDAIFWRIPYIPAQNTWQLNTNEGWGGGENGFAQIQDPVNNYDWVGKEGGGDDALVFVNSSKMDGSGNLYWISENNYIYSVAVDKTGNSNATTGGTVTATVIVDTLDADQGKMAVDGNGNIYFVENPAAANTKRVSGVFFISAAQVASAAAGNTITGASGTAEQQLQRIDSSTNPIVYAGVALDATGNLYLTSQNNAGYDQIFSGIWEIPNECPSKSAPSPGAVTGASCLNFDDISLISPFGGNNPVTIDSRGYIWDPTYEDPTGPGDGPYPGVYGILVWAPGSLNLSPALLGTGGPSITSLSPNYGPAGTSVTITGTNFGSSQDPDGILADSSVVTFNGTPAASITSWSNTSITAVEPVNGEANNVSTGPLASGPLVVTTGLSATTSGSPSNGLLFTVGATPSTVSTVGTIYVNFNQSVTLNAAPIQFAQAAGGGGGSDFTSIATNPNPSNPVATTPPGCTAATVYTAQDICQIWVGLDARAPGPISGQVTLSGVDTSSNPVSSTIYLSATGQGAEAAMLGSPAETTMAAGLQTPAQVAVDPLGDTYVADPGNHQVLYFAANSGAGGTPVTGTPVGGLLSAPTGVAVDGSGDVYIADSPNVFEIPAVNGSIAGQTLTTIATGFGKNLNLAVDGTGDVYVADPSNARVVRIPNPAAADLIANPLTSPSPGFSAVTIGSGFAAPSAVAVDDSGDVFVADGTTLWEVTQWNSIPTDVTSSLAEPVTGLAVDASGSVIVAQSGGLLRIPSIGGVLTVNGAGPLDTTVTTPSGAVLNITAPNGVALDQQGNLYVSDMTNGPNLYESAVTGAVNFGDALTPTEQATANVALYDIGNEPMYVTGGATFSGTGFDLSYLAALPGGTCDTTGATSVATGSSCTVEVGFTPPVKDTYTGDTMTVSTNAGNVANDNLTANGNITASLSGTALANLETVAVTVSLNPAASTYPGSTTATVQVAPQPDPPTIPATTNIPSGTVNLTLTSLATGSTYSVTQTGQAAGTDAGTTATFNLTGILGGTYCVTAQYEGSVANLFKPGQSPACSATPPYSPGTTFTVAQATPAITLSEPLGTSPNSSNGIYYVEHDLTTVTLTATVSSSLGTPTGTVTFMNGSQVVGTATPNADGIALFSTGALSDGSYNITAVYSGDQNFTSVSSPSVAFQVIEASVLITANPTSVSTSPGTSVASTLTLQALAGYSAPNGVNIVCDNSTLPYYSECTFSVSLPIICPPATGTGSSCAATPTTTVTISSNIPVNLPPSTTASVPTHGRGASPLIPAGIFGLGLFGLALRRRAVFNRYLLNVTWLSLLLVGAVMGFGGCTNSSYTKTPPPVTFTTKAGTYPVSICIPAAGSSSVHPCAVTASTPPQSLPLTLSLTIK